MNSTELAGAAAEIEAAARACRQPADQATDTAWADLHRGVAQQLQDRANQVKSWSATAAHWERTGQERPTDVVAQIDAAVAEALDMARVTQ